jgi:ArsR family transcriptional regulator, arsenate/arsenite/antimonite-responsive transcriptional repressor
VSAATIPQRRKNDSCTVRIEAPSLTAHQVEMLADCFKVLSDSTRLEMLDLLDQQHEPICVCDIAPRFPLNQPTISHHLKVLRGAGFIDSEKHGLWSHYWITDRGRATMRCTPVLLAVGES